MNWLKRWVTRRRAKNLVDFITGLDFSEEEIEQMDTDIREHHRVRVASLATMQPDTDEYMDTLYSCYVLSVSISNSERVKENKLMDPLITREEFFNIYQGK